jgi:hypothetical protein
VKLPAPDELTAAAGCSKVSGQLRAFADWLGPEGRMLTAAGNVRPADARELISLLGTGDEGLAFRSAPVATTVSFGPTMTASRGSTRRHL